MGVKEREMVSRARTINGKRAQRSQTVPKSFDNGESSGFVMSMIFQILSILKKRRALYSFCAG